MPGKDIATNVIMPLWWNWQTRGTQNPVVAIPCRFDPDQRHHKNESAFGRFVFYFALPDKNNTNRTFFNLRSKFLIYKFYRGVAVKVFKRKINRSVFIDKRQFFSVGP